MLQRGAAALTIELISPVDYYRGHLEASLSERERKLKVAYRGRKDVNELLA